MPRPAGAWQSPVAPGLDAWEDFVRRGGGERVLRPCQPPSSPGVTVPRRSQLAQEMWLVAASLWVSAAVFCLVTDALEMRFMTSSFLPTNRKRSRGEVFLPLRLLLHARERACARGGGGENLEHGGAHERRGSSLLPIYKGLARFSAAPFRAGAEQRPERAGEFCLLVESLRVASGRHCNPRPSVWIWPASRPMIGPGGQYRPHRSPRSFPFSGPAQSSESVHPLYSALERISKMVAAAP